jgi:hypothetical protein
MKLLQSDKKTLAVVKTEIVCKSSPNDLVILEGNIFNNSASHYLLIKYYEFSNKIKRFWQITGKIYSQLLWSHYYLFGLIFFWNPKSNLDYLFFNDLGVQNNKQTHITWTSQININ